MLRSAGLRVVAFESVGRRLSVSRQISAACGKFIDPLFGDGLRSRALYYQPLNPRVQLGSVFAADLKIRAHSRSSCVVCRDSSFRHVKSASGRRRSFER